MKNRIVQFLIFCLVVFGCVTKVHAQDAELPVMANTEIYVTQGNNGSYSHSGTLAYAWDWTFYGENICRHPLLAPVSGIVVASSSTCPETETCGGTSHSCGHGFGNHVIIEYDGGYRMIAHFHQIFVVVGQYVQQGEVLGLVGNTGYSTQAHIHDQEQETSSVGSQSTSSTYACENYSSVVPRYQSQYTSTNNFMFSEVEDSYGGYIGPATNAVHFYDSTTSFPAEDVDGNPDDVYIQNHDASGTSPGTSAIIYDAFGGARKAYLVRSGFWTFYDKCGGPNGDCSGVEDTGETCEGTANPNVHDCGAPINDEYEQEGGTRARQDFQSCYLYYDGDCVTTNTYPLVAPGWTDNGWNSTYSYAFAEAYERNGARTWMGEATTSVGEWSGELVQEFGGGYWGDLVIVHNPENNKAYLIRTGFWDKYQALGPSAVGYACQDEYPVDGGARQGFEKLTMYWNGSTITTVTKSSEEYGCERTAYGLGGSYTPTEDDLLVYNSTIYWVHNGSTHGVVSAEMFEACGFSWSDPYPVTEEVFSELPEGSVLDDPTDCGAVVDGTLVNQNGTVYEYWEADASWHGYPSELVFNACQNDWSSIQEMSSSVFGTITIGSVVGNSVDCGVLAEGDLVHWNGTVYRITDTGLKRGFTSAEVFNACGYDWDLILYLTDAEYPVVTTLQDGNAISNVSDCGYLTGEQITHLTPDLIWRETSTGTLGFWLMSGSTLSSWVTLGSSDLGWSVEGAGDFTGDGSVDFLWRHLSSPYELYLWEMNGTTLGSSVLVAGSSSPDWIIRGVADFTSDGEPDILWKDSVSGALSLWEMAGSSYVSSITIASSSAAGWDIRALGDLTGDGHTDILWRNDSTGELGLWEMDGTSYVSSILIASSSSTDWDVLALGDFTSDLQADLLWRNPTTGDMGVWEMDGTSYVSFVPMTSSSSAWTVVAVGEVDGN